MSTTVDPTQQPPPFPPVIQEQYKPHSGHGSVGPVIGVLAVIMVLGVVAVMIGRLCSGRRVMGHLQYDFEGWVETRCSSCIDGRLGPPLPREAVPVIVVMESGGRNVSSTEPPATSVPTESPEMTTEEEAPPHVEEGSNHQQSQSQEQHEN
ncbi:hypothetical protein SSX86_024047 [Deinandra increscens subsp. villosa]|uniref:Uncharacterized protein n=1 Tax=Deinandra increscens subsp. villosa TaxID=3103831 RepID=A0AAP0GRH1_9ASTR